MSPTFHQWLRELRNAIWDAFLSIALFIYFSVATQKQLCYSSNVNYLSIIIYFISVSISILFHFLYIEFLIFLLGLIWTFSHFNYVCHRG